jgi:hypothetical protein
LWLKLSRFFYYIGESKNCSTGANALAYFASPSVTKEFCNLDDRWHPEEIGSGFALMFTDAGDEEFMYTKDDAEKDWTRY